MQHSVFYNTADYPFDQELVKINYKGEPKWIKNKNFADYVYLEKLITNTYLYNYKLTNFNEKLRYVLKGSGYILDLQDFL